MYSDIIKSRCVIELGPPRLPPVYPLQQHRRLLRLGGLPRGLGRGLRRLRLGGRDLQHGARLLGAGAVQRIASKPVFFFRISANRNFYTLFRSGLEVSSCFKEIFGTDDVDFVTWDYGTSINYSQKKIKRKKKKKHSICKL